MLTYEDMLKTVGYLVRDEGHVVSVTDRMGRVTSFTYATGTSLVTSVTPPAALNPSFNVWDGLDRLIARARR